MAVMPKYTAPEAPFSSRICIKCENPRPPAKYIRIKSPFFPDGYSYICNDCTKRYLKDHNWDWEYVDKICQYYNIPFVPAEFERLRAANGDDVFQIYSQVFMGGEFEGLDWSIYNKEFKELEKKGLIRDELPRLSDEKRSKMIAKWGANYDDEALTYLENLYNGLLLTQNVNGALQTDQAIKICKISYELDCRIRSGADFDKMLASYDKLVKTAEFTPKNVKNANDFDSVGELVKWLEKKGWKNRFYDDVTRDVVDETMKNMESYNRRLYTNESAIGEEITRRIEALRSTAVNENYYDIKPEYDIDEFENLGYDELINSEFNPEV